MASKLTSLEFIIAGILFYWNWKSKLVNANVVSFYEAMKKLRKEKNLLKSKNIFWIQCYGDEIAMLHGVAICIANRRVSSP